MKKVIFLSLIITAIIGSCGEQKSTFPQGAWNFVHSDAVYHGDSIVNIFPSQGSGSDVKIWSERNYNYVGRFKFDTTFLDHFGGGTYTLDGNRYIENIIWDYKKDAIGKKVKMLLELRNDTLIQIFPVDENWQRNKDFYYILKYARI